jgi:hypothetical protein
MSAEVDSGPDISAAEFSAAEAVTGPLPAYREDGLGPDRNIDDIGEITEPIDRIVETPGLPLEWDSAPENPGETTLEMDSAAIANNQPSPAPSPRRLRFLPRRGAAPTNSPAPAISVMGPPDPPRVPLSRPAPVPAPLPASSIGLNVPPVTPPESTPTPPRTYPVPRSNVRAIEAPIAPVGSGDELQIHLVDEDALLRARSHEIGERRLSDALAAHKGAGSVLRNVWHRDFKEAARIARQAARHPVEGFKQHRDEIWKGNIARDYFLLKETRKARDEIRESGNVFIHDNADVSVHNREVTADVNRFVHEYHESMDAGEQRTQLVSPEAQPVVQAMHELIRDAVTNNWDEQAFREARIRRIDELANSNPALMKEASLYGDNLGQIVEQVRARIAAGRNLEDILANTQVYLDQSKMGVRTEVRYSKAEKVVEKLHSTKVGSMVNEAVIATAVSGAYTIARLSSKSAARAMLHPLGPVGLGVPSAMFAGVRESGRMKTERAQHMRERAQGAAGTFDSESKRAGFEASTYETVNATGARELLESALYERQPDGTTNLKAPTVDNLALGMTYLADLEVRRRMSTEKGIDLIGFSSAETVASERRALYLSMAQAKVDLRRMARDNPGMLPQLGSAPNFDMALGQMENTLINGQEREVTAKDRVFKQFKRREVGKAMGKAALFGVGLGLIGQEATAFFRGDEAGELKGLSDHYAPATGNVHQTVLRSLFDPVGGKDQLLGGGIHHTELINGHSVNVPMGTELVHEPNGSYDLMNGNTVAASGLHFQPDGHLTTGSLEHLKGSGVIAETHKHVISTVTHHDATVGAKDFVKFHRQDLTTVHRELWYDNDTPNVFDRNELKLWWGGNNGLDQHGNYVFNVSQMSPGGSFHDGLSANAQQLIHEGKLKVMLSMSEGTQDHVFEESVNSQGNIIINAHSEAAQLFRTQTVNGVKSAQFVGKFAEVDQVLSQKDGVANVRMLATAVGAGVKTMRAPTSTLVEHTTYSTTFEVIAPKAPVDVPPFIPIYGRRGLEPVEQPDPLPPEVEVPIVPTPGSPERPAYYNGGSPSPEQLRLWESQRSPRLLENSSAKLDMRQELDWYFADQRERQGEEYIRRLRDRVSSSEELRTLPVDIESIECIPVAAGVEGENIYRTLSLYAQQNPDDLSKSAVLLNLNWPSDADPAKVLETQQAVARAKREFPQVHIAVFEEVMPREWIDTRGAIYGHIVKELYDTALMAVQMGVESGDLRSEDVLIITNDADAKGLAKRYVGNYHKAARDTPEADVFLGTIRWGTESFTDYPGYATANTAAQLLQQFSRRAGADRNGRMPNTTGPNSGFRASALAAVGGANGEMGAGVDGELGARVWSARRATSSGTSGGASGSASPGRSGGSSDRQVGKMVVAAGVDSAPDRLLRTYMEGRMLTHAWDDYDQGGYRPRNATPVTGRERDDSPDVIIGRVEEQLSAIVTDWHRDETEYAVAFDLMFPPHAGGTAQEDVPKWEVVRQSDGRNNFSFTEAGRALVIHRFDRYGEFVARHLARTHVRPLSGAVGFGSAETSLPTGRPGAPAAASRPTAASGTGDGGTLAPSPSAVPSSGGEAASRVPEPLAHVVRSSTIREPDRRRRYDSDDEDVVQRAGGSSRSYESDDTDVIARERARHPVLTNSQRKERAAQENKKQSSQADSDTVHSVYMELAAKLRLAASRKDLYEVGREAVRAGLFTSRSMPDNLKSKPQRVFTPIENSDAESLYEGLLEMDEDVTSYIAMNRWATAASRRTASAEASSSEHVRSLYTPVEPTADADAALSTEDIDAIIRVRPSGTVLAALQRRLIFGGQLLAESVTPSNIASADIVYKQESVRLRPVNNVGLYALEQIDRALGRRRRRSLYAA